MTDAVTTDFRFAIVPEWLLHDSTVSAAAKLLYAVLDRFADQDTRECHPSRDTLAERCGCSVSTIKRVLAELIDAHAVTVIERVDDDTGRQRSNLYVVHRLPPEGRGSLANPRGFTDGPGEGFTSEPGRGSPVTREREPVNESQMNENSAQPALLDVPVGVGDFDAWWAAYPRHVDKARARKLYGARRRDGAPPGDLVRAASNYARSVAGTEPRFVKHPATFLAKDGPWTEWLVGSPDDHDVNAADERVDRANRQAAWGRR